MLKWIYDKQRILPKYCQPNPIKRYFGIFSESRCIKCQYTLGLGCKLYCDKDGNYELRFDK